MSTLGARVDAAIRASGKTADQIADTLDVDPNTISRLRTGREDNPKLQLLIGIARETGTTVSALLGEHLTYSRDDELDLLRFRGWIDSKLAIDALREPNAEIIRMAPAITRGSRIADRPRRPLEVPFGDQATVVLRAIGESMIEAGIANDDTLYAIPAGTGMDPAGKIIACRIGTDVFVKRLVYEHDRRYLKSAHPHYRPIAIDDDNLTFTLLAIVVGKSGRIE